MDDPHPSAREQGSPSLPQEIDRPLDVEDVEEHRVVDAGVGSTTTLRDKIPYFDDYVGSSGGCDSGRRRGDHRGIDVQGEHGTLNKFGRREGERAIAAPELDDAPARTRATEPCEDSPRVEEGLPIRLIRHPALASLHAMLLLEDVPEDRGRAIRPLPCDRLALIRRRME